MQMRLQKAMSQAGVASRRASEQLIREGRVRVNGRVVKEMGLRVDPDRDVIVVDGRQVSARVERRYIKLYKPRNVLSVLSDDRGRRSLGDLVPGASGLYPAGRLDFDSEGLVLLTNDGALTQRLTHPRYEHSKVYLVLVKGAPTDEDLHALRTGIDLEDGKTAPAEVDRAGGTPWGPAPHGQTWLRFVLHEGRKRQIRRMCDVVGCPVQRLIRTRIGPVRLGDLAPGEHRPLAVPEQERLFSAVGLARPERRGRSKRGASRGRRSGRRSSTGKRS